MFILIFHFSEDSATIKRRVRRRVSRLRESVIRAVGQKVLSDDSSE